MTVSAPACLGCSLAKHTTVVGNSIILSFAKVTRYSFERTESLSVYAIGYAEHRVMGSF